MNKFEEFYRMHEELEARYDACETDEQREEVRGEYKKLTSAVRENGDGFSNIMRLYTEMKERQNRYIDLHNFNQEEKASDQVADFRENGIEYFTFSSTWSSAVLCSWEFVKAGCELVGMIEINGTHKEFGKNEYPKVPAYLFKVK